MPKVVIETHGCKLNMADSIAMAANFAAQGFQVANDLDESPDAFILNSCTVTHVADRKARQRLSRIRREHPKTQIVMAGCYPTRDHNGITNLEIADLIVPNDTKPNIVREVAGLLAIDADSIANSLPAINPASALGRTRAALKIQEGCDQVCAYCIVPKVRGRERSVPAAQLVEQANDLAQAGCQEVILTGTQLGNYGFDLPHDPDNTLTKMLRRILRETDLPRIRVSSLQAPEIDDELLSLWNEEGRGRLCPHFHIPLQSGSNTILKRMRRTYAAEQFTATVELVREAVPTCSITTDIIAGFPGESDFDHQQSLEMLHRIQFADVHVFPYSRRPGTSAFHEREQIDTHTRSQRAAQLRNAAEKSATRYRQSELGNVRSVLWEDEKTGLTDNYLRTKRSAGVAEEGKIEEVRLVGVTADGAMQSAPVSTAAAEPILNAAAP